MKSYFSKELFALKLVGVFINGYPHVTYMVYSFLIVGCAIISYTFLLFLEMFKHNFEIVAKLMIYYTAGFSASFKIVVILTNRSKFGRALDRLQQKPFLPDRNRGGEEEEKLVNECLWITSIQSYTYWCLGFLTIVCTVLISLFKRLTDENYRDFPYGPFTLLNITQSTSYGISWAYQCFSVSLIGYSFVTVDLLICAIFAHIGYQFKVLQNYLRSIVEISYNRMEKNTVNKIPKEEIDTSDIPWLYLKESLTTAVDYHIAILDVAAEMESVFRELLLMAFLSTISELCFEVYMASVVTNRGQLLRHLIESCSALMQVALYSYWGEQITEQGRLVGNAVYESNFVGTDLRFQKAVAFIIRRSQTPTVVTAAKFTNIGLATFTWILRASYSAFMVLKTTN